MLGYADSTQGQLRSTGSGAFGDLPPGEPLEAASASQPTSQVASRARYPDMATHGPDEISADLSSTVVAAAAQPSNAAVSHVSGAAQQQADQPSAQDKQKQDQFTGRPIVGAVRVDTASNVPSQTTAVVPLLALGEVSGKKQQSSPGACCFF